MLYAIGDPGSKEGLTYKTMQVKDERKGILEKYYFLNNTICGAILLGDTSNLAKVTEAIEEMKSFGEFFK
ncbi:hypothetical protein SDC9_176275 [bioreactor metagenome]